MLEKCWKFLRETRGEGGFFGLNPNVHTPKPINSNILARYIKLSTCSYCPISIFFIINQIFQFFTFGFVAICWQLWPRSCSASASVSAAANPKSLFLTSGMESYSTQGDAYFSHFLRGHYNVFMEIRLWRPIGWVQVLHLTHAKHAESALKL